MRENPIMARHQRMPTEEAGYTYAVEPTATNRLLANEEESIYRPSESDYQSQFPTQSSPTDCERAFKFSVNKLKEFNHFLLTANSDLADGLKLV